MKPQPRLMHRLAAQAFTLALAACGAAHMPAARCADAGEQQVAGARVGNSFQWLGGPTALIERGGLRVITDPMLGPRGPQAFVLPKHPSSGQPDAAISRYTAPPPADLAHLDAILISHTHADHVDATAKAQLPKNVPLVVAAAGAEAMRAAGFTDVRPLDWGETLSIEARGTTLEVRAVPAHHSGDPELDREIGRGNGYVLAWRDARGSYRVYWTGDAVLSEETKNLTDQVGHIDLLLPHLGGVGGDGPRGLRTMDAEQAIELVRRVNPARVIPIHHTTFGHYREPIEALEQRALESGLSARFLFLREGNTVSLSRP
ncbi:MAG: hypothetical protein JWN04_4436 [Myxococcaceae bacterium]|nr:hypothetical protein [Myxococcaceae bacterium]